MWSSHLYSYRLITAIQLFYSLAHLFATHVLLGKIQTFVICNVNLKYVYVNAHLYSTFKLTQLFHESQLP